MKRSFLFGGSSAAHLVAASTALIAATYGLTRLAYGLFLPDMQRDLHLDATTAGSISAGASVVYCLGATGGFLTAGAHSRRLVVGAGLAAVLGALGMACSPTAAVVAGFAVLSSAGAGLASPALVQIIAAHLRGRAGDRAQTIANAGTGPGLVAAGGLALWLLPDWRVAWVVSAFVTAGATALVLVFDRHRRDRAPATPLLRPPAAWFLAHRRVVVAALLMGAGSAAVWNYGRTLLVDAGAGSRTSVLAWIALGTGGAAVIATAGLLRKVHPGRAWAITSGVIAVSTSGLVAMPDRAWVSLPACVAFGWGYTAASGALIGWTLDIDAARAAPGTALLFVVLILGQAAGALGTGALISGHHDAAAFGAAALTAGVGGLLGLAPVRAGGGRCVAMEASASRPEGDHGLTTPTHPYAAGGRSVGSPAGGVARAAASQRGAVR